jgi:hypothetical protein
MFARLLTTLSCVLSIAPCFVLAESAGSPQRDLVVYLKGNSNQSGMPLQEMKREVKALMQTAGYHVEWRDLEKSRHDVVGASLVVLELRGVCQVPQRAASVEPLRVAASLASSAVVNSEVLPFSWLECETLTKLLGPSLAKEPGGRRDFLYGRAMGRLVAHELLHVLTKARGHDDAGIGKPSFSAKDVLAEHFEFESTSIARFREPLPDNPGTVGAFDDESSGR